MPVAGVIYDQVQDDPDPAGVGFIDEPVEVRLLPEQGVDARVVTHVVPEVQTGRTVDRGQPQGVHAQPVRPQVIEMRDDPRQVPHPVPVRVREAARIDLVDDAALPPVVAEPGPDQGLDATRHSPGPSTSHRTPRAGTAMGALVIMREPRSRSLRRPVSEGGRWAGSTDTASSLKP